MHTEEHTQWLVLCVHGFVNQWNCPSDCFFAFCSWNWRFRWLLHLHPLAIVRCIGLLRTDCQYQLLLYRTKFGRTCRWTWWCKELLALLVSLKRSDGGLHLRCFCRHAWIIEINAGHLDVIACCTWYKPKTAEWIIPHWKNVLVLGLFHEFLDIFFRINRYFATFWSCKESWIASFCGGCGEWEIDAHNRVVHCFAKHESADSAK